MALSTKNVDDKSNVKAPRGKSKRELILGLMEHHKPLFEAEGVSVPKFIPRLCYKHKGEMVIGFYPKEVQGGKDIYIEFCDRQFNPEDPERTLWKWIYNPEFADEYEMSEPHSVTKHRRYIIPAEELINVTDQHKPKEVVVVEEVSEEEEDSFDDLVEEKADVALSNMTIRDFAALLWREPVSYKPWLNELIKNTQKK